MVTRRRQPRMSDPAIRLPTMRELIDALVRSAEREGMELYGVHVYRRGAEQIGRASCRERV